MTRIKGWLRKKWMYNVAGQEMYFLEEMRANPSRTPKNIPPARDMTASWKVTTSPPSKKSMFLEITVQSMIALSCLMDHARDPSLLFHKSHECDDAQGDHQIGKTRGSGNLQTSPGE